MKSLIFYFSIIISLISCGGQNQSNETSDSNDTSLNSDLIDSISIVEFKSEMRPGKTDWDVNEEFVDTLKFLSFEDNYDYWYAVFEAPNGESVYFKWDEPIEGSLNNSIFAIKWRVDSLWEAGEGDELYFQETLISFEILEESNDFAGFLDEFLHAYSRDYDDIIREYISIDLGFNSTFQPGVYCVLQNRDAPEVHPFISWDCIIAEDLPEGGLCEGYPGIEDGLYYENIRPSEMDEFTFNNDEGDFEDRLAELPEEFSNSELRKVQIIKDENHYAFLYFVLIDEEWLLWIEDLCDCSA